MGEHFLHQIGDFPDFILESVIRSIGANGAAIPQLLELDKQFRSIRILTHGKAWSNFPAKAMSLAGGEGNTKTTFTVDKTRDVRWHIHNKD